MVVRFKYQGSILYISEEPCLKRFNSTELNEFVLYGERIAFSFFYQCIQAQKNISKKTVSKLKIHTVK